MKRVVPVFAAVVVLLPVVACDGASPPIEEESEGEGEEGEGEEGEGEEGEGEEGEGEGVVGTCAAPGEFGAVSVGAGFDVVDVIDGAFIDDADRVAVAADGRVVAFLPGTGLLEEWGTWPDVAPSGTTRDPVLAAHRGGGALPIFFGRSMVFDGDTLLFTYAIGINGTVEGGLLVDEGDDPQPLLVHNPFSARLLGSRVLVGAAALGDQGATTAGAPQNVFALDSDGTVSTLLVPPADETGTDLLRIAFLDDDVVLSRFFGAGSYATHRLPKSALDDETDSVALPAGAADFSGEVVDSFDVVGGVAVVTGNGQFGGGTAVAVLTDAPGGLDVAPVVVLDDACTRMLTTFAVDGDLVVGVQDVVDGTNRWLQLHPTE